MNKYTEGAAVGIVIGGFIGGAGSPLVVIGLSLMLLFGGELATRETVTFKDMYPVQGNEER
jgi:hypothetical protein